MDPALDKLRAALEEYLAAGGDTPVAAEAQALMDAIDGGGDPGLEGGGLPSDGGLADLGAAPDAGMVPMDEGELEGMPPPQPEAKTFAGANAGATERLKRLNKR